MVNIKARGFESQNQLRELLEDVEDTDTVTTPEDRQAMRMIASLRAGIEDLSIRLGEMWTDDTRGDGKEEGRRPPRHVPQAVVTVASGAVAGFLLGLLAQRAERSSSF
jgi:hypothetical protein